MLRKTRTNSARSLFLSLFRWEKPATFSSGLFFRLFGIFALGVLVPFSGCHMQKDEALIQQLIIKPTSQPSVVATQLEPSLLKTLQAHSQPAQLTQIRPMSMGAYVVTLEPPLKQREAEALAQQLSALPGIEYVEPDYARHGL